MRIRSTASSQSSSFRFKILGLICFYYCGCSILSTFTKSSSSSSLGLFVDAAIFNFDLILKPSQETVQYNDGYIRGPGSIDLSNLTFTAISGSYVGSGFSDDDEFGLVPTDDAMVEGNGDGDDGTPNDDDSRRRLPEIILPSNSNQRVLEGGVEQGATYVDIVIFSLPSKCAHAKAGCDWTSLGVGKRTEHGQLRWCCTMEAVTLGLCVEDDNDTYGRLMIDKDKFTGERRFVSVPQDGTMQKQIRYGKIPVTKSGTYVVLYANCNMQGREIAVQGKSIWKSAHGYLPGELFGFMYFYTFVTCLYGVLCIWFGYLMHQYKETRIEIEKWIIFSIGLGLLEMTFRSLDYYIWNGSGIRSSFVIWIGIMIGVLKQGISRCLSVMVSMGWGVCRDSLPGTAFLMSVGLAVAYIVTSGMFDYLVVFAFEHVNSLSTKEETSIINFANVLGFGKSLINAFFIVWILYALSKTLHYLEANNEKTKLERMEKLRNIFVCAVCFAVIWFFFSVFDRYKEEGIVAEEHAWAKDAASEVNYLFVLIGIAILWRPNESAQNYAYFKELSPLDYDDEEEDLELSDMNN